LIKSRQLKLYVWEKVLYDYSSGMMVALAHSPKEAMSGEEDKGMNKWRPLDTGEKCPICKNGDLEILADSEGNSVKERCKNGCYVYNFETERREK